VPSYFRSGARLTILALVRVRLGIRGHPSISSPPFAQRDAAGRAHRKDPTDD